MMNKKTFVAAAIATMLFNTLSTTYAAQSDPIASKQGREIVQKADLKERTRPEVTKGSEVRTKAAESKDEGTKTIPAVPVEDTVVVKVAKEEVIEEPEKAAVEAKERKIIINIASRSLALYDGSHKLRLYPIGVGKITTPTPTGYYKVLNKEVNPTWVDPGDEKNVIPSGERNPLGYRWMQFIGNYGIHGTNNPSSIGSYVSNGCIRMLEHDVEELFDMVSVGTPVEITYNRIVVEQIPDQNVVYYVYPDGYRRQSLTTEMVSEWLAGYGVDNFETDDAIVDKIKKSDGMPTFLGKSYRIVIDGKNLSGKAVVRDGIAYLPVGEFAKITDTALGWNAEQEILVSSYGKAMGYMQKDVLYCHADDVGVLFPVDGGLNAKRIFSYRSNKANK